MYLFLRDPSLDIAAEEALDSVWIIEGVFELAS